MSESERNSIDNLILVCPNHHREIDRLQPQNWPADRLMEIKLSHEGRCDGNWATDADLEHFASVALSDTLASAGAAAVTARARLELQKGDGDSYEVVNVGSAEAHDINFVLDDVNNRSVIRLDEDGVPRLSPGAKWTALIYAPSVADSGAATVLVRWTESDGTRMDAAFPL